MSDPAVQELVQPPRTAAPARRGWLLRVIVAVAVVGVAVWYLRAHRQERAVAPPGADRAADRGAPADSSGRPARGDTEGRVVTVQIATAERKDLPIWLEGLGSVAAMQQVTLRPQVDGRIDKVLFIEGQPVKKGDVLVQIDPRPFVVALHQAQGALARDKAQLETNEVNLKRYQSLKAQNLVAGQQVEEIAGQVGQFEGSVKIDQAQIENAQLQLDYTQVRSPLDGIAGIRQVDAGNIVHQSDANGLVVITAIDPAAVFFTLPQDQLSSVAQALARGDVTVEAYSRDGATKLATGKLAVLDNQVNQSTATLRLKALMPNPERALWPNAFVKARMLVETRKDAIVIPAVAVQRGPQGTFVYVVGADKTAQMKPVTVSLTTGDVAVISKGLDGGEHVIIEGQNQVRPGGRVEPAPQGGAAPGPGAGSGSGSGRRGKRGDANADGATPPAAPTGEAPANGSGAMAPSRAPGGHAVTGQREPSERPASGQSPRGPAAGPTASLQPATK
jgi:membrane fusion protein, multidrug efflux system